MLNCFWLYWILSFEGVTPGVTWLGVKVLGLGFVEWGRKHHRANIISEIYQLKFLWETVLLIWQINISKLARELKAAHRNTIHDSSKCMCCT